MAGKGEYIPPPRFDSVGYFIFDGGNPGSKQAVIDILYKLGFTGCNQTYIAKAICDNDIEKLANLKTVVQVSYNGVVGFAVRVWPVTYERNTRDFVAQTYAGCERQSDILMLLEKDPDQEV